MSAKLAIRLPNWLGDVLMSLPAIEGLAAQGYDITLIGKPWVKDLLAAYPFHFLPIPTDVFKARRAFKKRGLCEVLLFTNSLSSAAQVFFAGSKAMGYRGDVRTLFLHRSLAKLAACHEVRLFWNLAHFLVNEVHGQDFNQELASRLSLALLPKTIQEGDDLLRMHSVDGDFIVLCPGAIGQGMQGESKVWPHWLELSTSLSKQGLEIVACPGPGEEAFFKQNLAPQVKLLTPVPLGAYAAILKRARCVIANDSGPMHLAAACGAKVLGLFGVTNPLRTSPWGGDSLGDVCAWPSLAEVLAWSRLNGLDCC